MTPRVMHRLIFGGLMSCGVRERDTGARGTLANRFVTCPDCRARTKAQKEAAKARAGR